MNTPETDTSTGVSPSPAERALAVFVVVALLLGLAALLGFARANWDFDVTRPFSVTGLLALAVVVLPLAAAMFFMRRWGVHWSDYGLNFRLPAWRILLYSMGALIVLHIAAMVIVPWAVEFTDQPPDVSHLMGLPGNLAGLVLALILMWITAAFIEEMLCRGFLMNEAAGALGSGKLAWAVSVVLVGAVFGLAHAYQGISGMLTTGGIGIVLGVLYLLMSRNLWPLIIAHGLFNSIQLYQVYALG